MKIAKDFMSGLFAPLAGFALLHVERSETGDGDAVTLGKSIGDGGEDGIDSHFGGGFRQSRCVRDAGY